MKASRKIRKRRRTHRHPPGTAPGTLATDPAAGRLAIRVLSFGPESVEEHATATPAEAADAVGRHAVTWIDVSGTGDAEGLTALESHFGIHRLALEDVVHLHQRPKVEEYDNLTYVVARMPVAGQRPETEQLSLFLGANFVLSFQEEKPGDCLDPVRERIRGRGPRLMKGGADYLLYAILDTVVDSYFPIVETIREELEEAETRVFDHPDPELPRHLHAVKRELYDLRRTAWSFREVFNALTRGESGRITPPARLYLRDCYDHTIQLVESTDSLRDTASGLMEFYLSSLSNRLNEVMKVLTIIATVFIPLTFIAGVYGMNFDPDASPWSMPELRWKWGYLASWGIMLAVAALMLGYFVRKGWIRPPRRRPGGSPPDA